MAAGRGSPQGRRQPPSGGPRTARSEAKGMSAIPLSVLDLVPVASGQTPADAVRNSVDLAQHAERLGYHRYWFAEHHLNPGVAGTDPARPISLGANPTRTVPVGPGGGALAPPTPPSVGGEIGVLGAAV